MTTSHKHTIVLALASGGLVFSTLHAVEPSGEVSKSPAPKIAVDTRPIDRDGRMPNSFANVIRLAAPSVVKIEVTATAEPAVDMGVGRGKGATPFGGVDPRRGMDPRHGQMPREHGAASGVIVTPDGYILTNNHVVDHAEKVEITLHDGRSLVAKVVGTDPKSDLAVVKVDAIGLPAITFADSSLVEVGDIVLAAGNPFGIGESVTMGMVSAIGRATMGLDYEDFIQTDAAINPGNSGGALVDAQGRLVGINTAILSRSGGNDGVGFAIPSNMAHNIMEELIANGKIVRASLGVMVQDLTPELAQLFKTDESAHGALVGDVLHGSSAEHAGIQSGDVVTQFAGQPVKDARALKLAVANHKAGEKAEVTVLRDGQTKTLTATLQNQPGTGNATDESLTTQAQKNEGTLNGVGVADLDREVRREANVPANIKGAIVTGVEEGSPAWEAGLRPGDVIEQINHEVVTNAESAVKLTEAPATTPTLVKVWSHGGSHFVVVDETAQAAS